MPLYEYICRDCGTLFDALRSMKDADQPIHCSQCDSEHTTRQLSLFFAQSDGKAVAGSSSCGCAGCSGGSCSTCNN
jgi:putative FmdB family regulatory protein